MPSLQGRITVVGCLTLQKTVALEDLWDHLINVYIYTGCVFGCLTLQKTVALEDLWDRLINVYTGCVLHRQTAHLICHGISQRMHAFYTIKTLPQMGWQINDPLYRETNTHDWRTNWNCSYLITRAEDNLLKSHFYNTKIDWRDTDGDTIYKI
jgi:hypothetical protein